MDQFDVVLLSKDSGGTRGSSRVQGDNGIELQCRQELHIDLIQSGASIDTILDAPKAFRRGEHENREVEGGRGW